MKYKVIFESETGDYEELFDTNETLISALAQFGKKNIASDSEYTYKVYNQKGELLNKDPSKLDIEADDIICLRCKKILKTNDKIANYEMKNILLTKDNELEVTKVIESIEICEQCQEDLDEQIFKKWIELENLIKNS